MATVKRVIDGDTFETDSGQRIRLANVDAPETGKKGATLATAKLRDLVEGENVRITTVGKSYNRDVAKVSIKGKSVNETMNKFLAKRAPAKKP